VAADLVEEAVQLAIDEQPWAEEARITTLAVANGR
jgi:hypothetical protein